MLCYGQQMRMFLWSTVIFYESESEQQRWNEVYARVCYGKVGMMQDGSVFRGKSAVGLE
jgi:hypothetical protein